MTSRQSKKEKFTAGKKSNKGMFMIIAVALLGIAGLMIFNNPGSNVAQELQNVGAVSYQGQSIQMTDVENVVENGKVKITLSDVTEGSIIYTEYNNGNVRIPLTSFVTPKGNVVAAVSMCEPCRGYKFHIEGNELVCNACGTRWALDGLKGISGGCLNYPPDTLSYEMDESGQYMMLDEEEVATWQPRPL